MSDNKITAQLVIRPKSSEAIKSFAFRNLLPPLEDIEKIRLHYYSIRTLYQIAFLKMLAMTYDITNFNDIVKLVGTFRYRIISKIFDIISIVVTFIVRKMNKRESIKIISKVYFDIDIDDSKDVVIITI